MSKEPEFTLLKALTDLYTAGLHYIGYVAFAVIGGTVNYLHKLQSGEVAKFKLIVLLGECLISGFAGLLAALLAISLGFGSEAVFFYSGIAGHLGARGIILLQLYVVKKFNLDTKSKKG